MNTLEKYKFVSFDLYAFLVLIAFEILMSFTFLGYIHIEPISITFAYIPILIAACLLGTVQSTVMGLIFGIASMYKSTAYYVTSADILFSPMLSGNFWGSLILAVGTRVLFGFLTGIAFAAAKKQKRSKLWIGIVSAVMPSVHAFLVMWAMDFFFPGSTKGYFQTGSLVASHLLSSAVCVLIVRYLWAQYSEKSLKNVRRIVNRSKKIQYIDSSRESILISVFAVFVFTMTLAAAIYFSERVSIMLKIHDVDVSGEIISDLYQLQIQFTAAMLSLNIISIVVFILGYECTAYKNFIGELDAVTGVMGRRIFLDYCEKAQKNYDLSFCRYGWFMFLDVDSFKTINDTYGHSMGDEVLKEIASILQKRFDSCGAVGRMGGDEFAVIIDKRTLSEYALREILDGFYKELSEISLIPGGVSCSTGISRFNFPADVSFLMHNTDTLLYQAKENGRAQYIIA